jgi:RNA polymerase sigma-70 factor (ECF subfamily)
VDAAKTGNEAALSELYALYFPRVYRYILARTGNSYDAEDLTEEVFMKVLEAIERFEWREAPFSAWLFRIAHNAVISQRRKDGARGRSAPLTEGLALDSQGPDELVENRLALREIMNAAQKLPEAQRQVIALRFGAGLSVAETARAMNKGEGNVKVIQHKAIAKLREMVRPKPKAHEEKV